jgi:hypothetical protein
MRACFAAIEKGVVVVNRRRDIIVIIIHRNVIIIRRNVINTYGIACRVGASVGS